MTLNEKLNRIVELDNIKEEYKEKMKELDQLLEEVVNDKGIDFFFQDHSSGIVYKTVVPTGRYIEYHKYGYKRTKKEGERAGSLSMKEARENGFDI